MEIQQRLYLNKKVVTFLLISVITSGATPGLLNGVPVHASPTMISDNIIFVGGSEEGNYSSIQDAIENASENTIIYIYQGTYKEHLFINKSIRLRGFDTIHTVINGNETGTVVTVLGDSVILSNLTIKNSGTSSKDAAVLIKSSNVTIKNTIITRNRNGIYCQNASATQIIDNEISFSIQDGNGIVLNHTNDSMVSNNKVTKHKDRGIILQSGSTNNIIMKNIIERNSKYGIYIHQNSSDNKIFNNTFRSKGIAHAYDNCSNKWDQGYPIGGNWWEDYDGSDEFYGPHQNFSGSDMIGDTPYEIKPNGNNDNYPLIDALPRIIVDDDFLNIIAGWNHIRFRSIQNAIDHADPYSVITINEGMYEEHLFVDKPLSIIANDGDEVIVDGDHNDTVIIINASHAQISGLNIRNSGNESNDSAIFINAGSTSIKECSMKENAWGITVHSSNNELANNRIRNNKYGGIYIQQGLMNYVNGNEISYCVTVGILLFCNGTNHTVIEDNYIHNITGDGLKLVNTSYNTIMDNIVIENTENGIVITDQSFFNEILDNKILSNVKNGIHLNNITHLKYPTIIQNNTIRQQKDAGIFLCNSKNCTILSNTVLDNTIGISLNNATRNTLVLNEITKNHQFGLCLEGSSDNHIYNNNIKNEEMSTAINAFDNGQNVWNGSYCIGGNHWDGHDGTDACHGHDQQKQGRDGIYDSSYQIMTSEDHYPYVMPNGWDHRLLIEAVLCGSCGTIGHLDFDFIKGLSVNIINFGQHPTQADLLITVHELYLNNTMISRIHSFEETYELFVGPEDQLFITLLTDDSLWKGQLLRLGITEITIILDFLSWKGYAFCYRSFFFLLRQEFQ